MEYLSFDGEMLHVYVTSVHDVSDHNNVMSINSTHHHANKYQLVSFLFLFVLFISYSLLNGCTNGIFLFPATCFGNVPEQLQQKTIKVILCRLIF